MRLAKGLGKQRNPDHQLGPGAESGDEAVDSKVEDALRKPLQRSEDAVERDAEGERAHPADIIGDDAEREAAEGPAQEPGHAEQSAIFADLGH